MYLAASITRGVKGECNSKREKGRKNGEAGGEEGKRGRGTQETRKIKGGEKRKRRGKFAPTHARRN